MGERRGLSIGGKLATTTVAALGLVSLVVVYILSSQARQSLLDAKSDAAVLMTDLFSVSAVAPLDFGDDEDLKRAIDSLRVNRDITYAALWREAREGRGDADPPRVTLGALPEGPPAARLLTRPELPLEVRVLPDYLEVRRLIVRPDRSPAGAALVRFSLAPEAAQLDSQRRAILLGTAGAAGALSLLILGLARAQIVAPLDRLVSASNRLRSGDTSATVTVESGDELGKLAAAFNTMSEAIRDREAHLAEAMARLRELFDNMRQGIVVFGADLRVEEAPSRAAAQIFGEDVAGREVLALIYPRLPEGHPLRDAFAEWLGAAFHVPVDAWEEFAALAPSSVQRPTGGADQFLELQFIPVVEGGRAGRIMMLATDVTDRTLLEQATRSMEEEHAAQMSAMRRLVAGGGQVFASFLASAEARLRDAEERAAAAAPLEPSLVLLFEAVHTLRGEARTFDLNELDVECRGIEHLLKELRAATSIAPESRRALAQRLGRAHAAVARAREMFVAASPIGEAILDQVTVRQSDLDRLGALVGPSGGDLGHLVGALVSRPFGECVVGLASAAVRWADEASKPLRVVIEGREARVPRPLAPVLTAMLPHVVRNAIAHGIEPAARRRQLGKPETALIRIAAAEADRRFTVTVGDDGAGIDEPALVARARELGLGERSPEELAFVAGLSTAERAGDLAGFGMGLSAVRERVRRAGGDVRLTSVAGRGLEVEIVVPWEIAS